MLFGRSNNVSKSSRQQQGASEPAGRSDDSYAEDTAENPTRGRMRGGASRLGSLLAATGGAGVVALKLKPRILPVVLIHGVLSSAIYFEEAADWVHTLGDNVYVRCIEVGNGEVDSITRTMEWQLARLAEELQSDPNLRNGFNIIAHSQGTLLARGFIQRYDWPQVDTFISWVGPQAGQFGVPAYEPLLGYMNRLVSGLWYEKNLQSESGRTLSFSNYWRDPTKLDIYLANLGFLADINNERPVKNASYARRLARLSHFVLVYSPSDQIIQPAISSWFGFYKVRGASTLHFRASLPTPVPNALLLDVSFAFSVIVRAAAG